MPRLRANLAPILWLTVFSVILILWVGSHWWAGAVRMTIEDFDDGGFTRIQVSCYYAHFRCFWSTGNSAASTESALNFSLTPVGGGPTIEDVFWIASDRQVNLGVVRWCRVPTRNPAGLSPFHALEAHSGVFATVAAFFTFRSWRKRRRVYIRGFDVTTADR